MSSVEFREALEDCAAEMAAALGARGALENRAPRGRPVRGDHTERWPRHHPSAPGRSRPSCAARAATPGL